MADKNELKADTKDGAEQDAVAEGAEDSGSGSRKKTLIIAGVMFAVLLLGGGTAAYFSGALDKVLGKAKPDCESVTEGDDHYDDCAAELAAKAEANLPGTFFAIPDMIVNLNATGKQARFLKISLKVELEKAEDLPKFELILPRVVDQFQTYLRELRIEDLRGSSGMYRMKIELLSRVKAAAPSIKVRDVLFQEILVQ